MSDSVTSSENGSCRCRVAGTIAKRDRLQSSACGKSRHGRGLVSGLSVSRDSPQLQRFQLVTSRDDAQEVIRDAVLNFYAPKSRCIVVHDCCLPRKLASTLSE